MMDINAEKLAMIETQLGRKPRGIVKIAAETSTGIPMVLQIRSWLDNEPFPTLYWLCSKDLHRAISHIETAGFVKDLEQRLEVDAAFRQRLLADQAHYRDKRLEAMNPQDKAQIKANGFQALFASWGIGGIKNWASIRCLHMHYAHHLADQNVIGEILDEEFGLNNLTIHI